MSKCKEIKKLLSAYQDNEVTDAQRVEIETHLGQCLACKKYWVELTRVSGALQNWKDEEVSADLAQKIRSDFLGDKYKGVVMRNNTRTWVGISSVALAVLLVFTTMQVTVRRGIRGGVRENADSVGGQLDTKDSEYVREERNFGDWSVSRGVQTSDNYQEGVSRERLSAQSLSREVTARRGLDYTGGEISETEYVNGDGWSDSGALHNSVALDKINAGDDLSRYSIRGDNAGNKEKQLAQVPVQDPNSQVIILEPYIPATGTEDKVIREAGVKVEVADVQASYDKVTAISKKHNGYLGSANFQRSASGLVSASIILRIPKQDFEAVLDELRALGEVKQFDINSRDVSQEYASLQNELKAVKVIYDKLEKKYFEKKIDVPEAARIESELAPYRQRMESLANQISQYDNLISMSTIRVTLTATEWNQMWKENMKETKGQMITMLAGLLRGLVAILPLLVSVLAIALGIAMVLSIAVAKIKKAFKNDKKEPEQK